LVEQRVFVNLAIKKGKAIEAADPPAEPAIRRPPAKTAEPRQLRVSLRCLGLGG